MKDVRGLVFISFVSFLMLSCGGNQKNKSFVLQDVEFVYDGPLYEGSNQATFTVEIDLKAIFKDAYKDGITIEHAELKEAKIVPTDSESFAGISALVLSLASDNADIKMRELAVLNPVDTLASKAFLKPSPKADATDYFGEKQFYVVLDATLAKDMEASLKLKGDFKFELSYQ